MRDVAFRRTIQKRRQRLQGSQGRAHGVLEGETRRERHAYVHFWLAQ